MYIPAMAWQHFGNDCLTLPKQYISCHKVAKLVIAGNYVAMWMHHCHSVAMKLLNFKIASEAVEAAQSYAIMLKMMGVGFSKGGQN